MPEKKHIVPTACATDILPVELFVELLSTLVDEDPPRAISLSHVCRRWREIVIATPALWRTLVLSDRDPWGKLELWKERSKPTLSSLTLRVGLPHWCCAILHGLEELHWDHLETLHVHNVISGDFFANLQKKRSLAKLKRILLDSCYVTADLSEPNLGLAPNELHILNCTTFSQNRFFQFNQLRILHLRHVFQHGPVPLGMMRDAPLLEDFVLVFAFSHETRCGLDNPLPEFKHLRSIELGYVRDTSSLLNLISAPSLQHLTIFGATSMIDEGLHHVICDGNILTSLKIENCAVRADTLVSLLPHVPRLEELHINGIDEVANPVLWFLAGRGHSGGLAFGAHISLPCPCLKDVDVSRCSDLETSSVLALVNRHLQGEETCDRCCRIESLRVDRCPKVDADQLPWFGSNVELCRFNMK